MDLLAGEVLFLALFLFLLLLFLLFLASTTNTTNNSLLPLQFNLLLQLTRTRRHDNLLLINPYLLILIFKNFKMHLSFIFYDFRFEFLVFDGFYYGGPFLGVCDEWFVLDVVVYVFEDLEDVNFFVVAAPVVLGEGVLEVLGEELTVLLALD